MQDATFQLILEQLADRLGHGVFVDSVDGRLIGYSSQDARADPARVAAIMARRVAPELRRWQNRHGIAGATGPVRLPANADLGIRARLCAPIRDGRRCLGYLWVPETGQETEPVRQAAAELARYLAGRADERDDLLRDLLTPARPGTAPAALPDPGGEGRWPSGAAAALERLAALDPALLTAEVVVCAAVPADPGRPAALTGTDYERLVTALPRALRADPACVASFVTPTQVTALFHGAPPRPGPAAGRTSGNARNPAAGRTSGDAHDPAATDRGAGALDRALRATVRSRFAVGVSEPARFLVEPVRHAHTQATTAAEAAARDPALPRILPWSKAGPYRMLAARPGERDPVLDPLERAGDAGILLTTLETYLDLGGDVRRAAAALHVHRTTVYYRLDRVAEILNVDLRDGLTRSHLHLALKARRLKRHR
ncbi:helix-turn-helix domain-containing protein [Nonomuraea rubra]|uniref:helix-turn-helix domain-containing protein n=1 Tax=Nonomuraea rubra TaxID=46180 RepID=UPI0033D2B918